MKVFLLAGLIQGILLALFFLFNKTNKNAQAQKWLGTLLLLVSITIGFALLFINNGHSSYTYLIRVGELLPFLFPPIIYFYTVSLTYGEIKLNYKHLILLLPFLIGVIILSPFYLADSSLKLEIYYQMQKGVYPLTYKILFAFKSLFGLTMLLISFKAVMDVKKKMKHLFSNDKDFQWLIYSIGIMLFLWIVGTSRALMGYTPAMGGVTTVVVVFIYTLSYFTLKQKQIFREADLKLLIEIDNGEPNSQAEVRVDLEETKALLLNSFLQEAVVTLKDEIKEVVKYKNSTLKKDEAEKAYQKIVSIVQEQSLFLDKSITLQQLSVVSEIKPSIISETLNKHYNTTFYSFINQIRAKEASLRLKDSAHFHLTIDAIGEECGFKSKSTFYQSFKELTGQTPKEYKASFF